MQEEEPSCRCYLGISGGFDTEIALGSRSWFEGVTTNYRLEKGMTLKVAANLKTGTCTFSRPKVEIDYLEEEELIVFPGPEYIKLPLKIKEELEKRIFTVGNNSNRMAVQLEGKVENNLNAIITALRLTRYRAVNSFRKYDNPNERLPNNLVAIPVYYNYQKKP
ncbi:biotin-dependent carboxyltransferase family protein [Antarcticibacterium sp. 1MA-6-2]|nr:biotin-dependent carboxyltransferase family protein [Antarcticibacterium sp. 1MA-6-2]